MIPRFRPEVLVAARERQGWTVADLASRLDVALAAADVTRARSPAARDRVSKWERGMETPSPRFVPVLARTINVDAIALFDVDPDALTFTQLRYVRGWTETMLAETAGVGLTMFRRTVAGHRPLSGDVASRLANALRVSRAELQRTIAREA